MVEPVLPHKLAPGDTISIVAPSEPVEKEDVMKTKEFLEAKGYKVKLGKHLFYRIGDYTAGTIEDRASDLNAAFADPDSKAIIMGTGGYAADQVLNYLDFEIIKKNPKIFVGFSDATVLQLTFLAKTGLVTFYGPNAASLFQTDDYSLNSLWQVITGDEILKIEKKTDWEVLRPGKGKGMLVGGNLDCVCSMLGTSYDPFDHVQDQPILFFWEDWASEYNLIIRNLYQLKHAGIFRQCQAMIVGKLTDVSEEDYVGVPELRYTLLQMAREFDFPILWGVDFGHEVPKMTIPIGVEGHLDTKTMSFGFKKGTTD